MEEDKEVPQDAEAVGNWLRELRTRAKLSQAAAGEAIGVDASEIRRWENKNAPGGVNLLRLLSAYGVKITPPPPEDVPGAVNAELRALRNQVTHQIRAFDVESTMAISSRDVTRLKGMDRVFFQSCLDAITNRTWDDPQVRWAIGKQAGLTADDPEMAFTSVARRYHDIVAWIQQQKTAEALMRMAESARSPGSQAQGEGGDPPEYEDLPGRLRELEATVAELASAEDVELGFRSLEAAIARLVRERRGEDPPQAGTGG